MNRFFLAQPVTLLDYKGIQNDFDHIIQGRWVPTQNLHLTLQFFGPTFEKEFLIDRLSKLHLRAEISEIKGLECFKDNQILYAKTLNPSLNILHAQVEEALDLPHQEFIPHISLMRIKKIHHEDLLHKRIHLYDQKVIGTLHPTIQLIESKLTPEGAIYTLIKEF